MWFWAKCALGVTLRATGFGKSALPFQFSRAQFLVIRTGQRDEKRNHVVNFIFGQSQRLNVLVQPGIFDPIPLVIMVHGIPERRLRTVVKVGCRHQHVSGLDVAVELAGGVGGTL